jgi:hypothetical protein
MKSLARFGVLAALVFSVVGLSTTDASAQRVGGQLLHEDRVMANAQDTYKQVFTKGPGYFEVEGDGDTDLDCYVVNDSTGDVIAQDVDGTDHCIVSFYMYRAAVLRLVVRNQGDVYNNYTMLAR